MGKQIVEVRKKSTGLGFTSILTLIFVIAKLFGIIDWSWWICLLPTIISTGLGILLFLICLIIAIISEL